MMTDTDKDHSIHPASALAEPQEAGAHTNPSKPKAAVLSKAAIEAMREGLLFGGSLKNKKSTKFQKGQSGNPRGRPKLAEPSPVTLSMLPTKTIILTESERLVTLREGDKVTKIPAREAVMRSLLATAVKGNAMAQKTALALFQKADAVSGEAHQVGIACRGRLCLRPQDHRDQLGFNDPEGHGELSRSLYYCFRSQA